MVEKRTKWMLRVSYDMGPNFGDNARVRNKEFDDYPSEYAVFIMKKQILTDGTGILFFTSMGKIVQGSMEAR